MTESARIRRFYPGTDPARLTWRQFAGHLERIAELHEWETGGGDHASKVARMERRRNETDG